MENPCEKCLVKMMCFAIACDGLHEYMDFLIKENKLDHKSYIPKWITHYELRPKVVEYAKGLGITKLIAGDLK